MDHLPKAEELRENLDTAVQNVGEKISEAGAQLWENAPAEGVVGEVAGRIAAQVEAGGEYLASRRSNEIVEDFKTFVQGHPFGAAALVFTAGFLLGSLLGRR